MEDTNKRIVRLYIEEVLNRGHLERVDELFVPELRDQVKRIASDYRSAFPDMHEKIETLVAEGETVAAVWIFSGTHRAEFLGIPPTEREIEIVGMSVYYLKDGLIVDDMAVLDLLGAARQLGATLSAPELG